MFWSNVTVRLLNRSLPIVLCISLCISLLSGLLPARSISQPAGSYFVPPPPPNQGSPVGRSRGGASRGNCPAVTVPLTALVPTTPSSSEDQTTVWGQTTAAHPTFWFYVPYALTLDRPAEFVLQDAEGTEIYRTVLPKPGSEVAAGMVQVSVPSTVTPLATNTLYQWAFMVNCEADNPTYTKGWIQRVTLDPALATQIQQASPTQKAMLYANHGIWFDALTTLVELHRTQPQNPTIATHWETLLQSAGLGDLVDKK